MVRHGRRRPGKAARLLRTQAARSLEQALFHGQAPNETLSNRMESIIDAEDDLAKSSSVRTAQGKGITMRNSPGFAEFYKGFKSDRKATVISELFTKADLRQTATLTQNLNIAVA